MRNILIVITSIFLFNTFLCAFVSSCVDIIGIIVKHSKVLPTEYI